MDYTERKVTGKTVFEGHIIQVELDEIALPNGRPAQREVVRHPGGVCVLALDQDGQVTLVRQYRYPMAEHIIELPAGKLDPGEEPSAAARRELEEETGLRAGKLTYLGYLLASPGFCDERLHMFLAQELEHLDSHPDEDEFLDVFTMPYSELLSKVMAGELHDAKSVAITLKTKVLLGL